MSHDENRRSLLGGASGSDAPVDVLRRADFGVLGLTKESEAYTVPLSFGYDDELTTLYFLLAFDEGSKKRECMATTDVASFVVVDSELPDAWQSIHFTGTLDRVPEEKTEVAYQTLAETAAFPALYTFEEYVEESTAEQELYGFDVETVSARQNSTA
ncbi:MULTISPECIES: pyridoxamine 5'-phosphate oxidase family protein [Salinibaculum]|uniref:pyridoxamine 5'-phosphate oxidase family protein n=1 Tax=Salinibaculum TaxID=2732368 RepID=UPI0030D16AEC